MVRCFHSTSPGLAIIVVMLALALVGCSEKQVAVDGPDIATNQGLELIEFSADWCAPCRQQKPVIAKLERELDWVTVHVVDVDQRPDLAESYHVRGIPHMAVKKDGRIVATLVGFRGESELRRVLERAR